MAAATASASDMLPRSRPLDNFALLSGPGLEVGFCTTPLAFDPSGVEVDEEERAVDEVGP